MLGSKSFIPLLEKDGKKTHFYNRPKKVKMYPKLPLTCY